MKREPIKRGRVKIGAICELSDGREILIAYRRLKDMDGGGETNLSEAIRSGKAKWSVSEELLIRARSRAIPFIGVVCTTTNDLYVTKTDWFFDRERFTYVARRHTMERALPLHRFRCIQRKVSIK